MGTPITFTAQAQGGSGDYEYFFQRKGPDTAGAWLIVQNYAVSNSITWTPAADALGDHEFQVRTRHSGATVDYEARTSIPYTIDNTPGAVQQAATDLIVSTSVPSPQRPGTTITLTAQGQGGSVGSYEYRFAHNKPNRRWVTLQEYAPNNTLTWSPTDVGEHQIMVWVRNVGSTATYEALTQFAGYRITDSPSLSGVTLTASPTSPRPVGTAITITAQASSGSGSYTYIIDRRGPDTNGQFVRIQQNNSNNTFSWTPTVAGDHDFRVYAYNNGVPPYQAAANLCFLATEASTAQAAPTETMTKLAAAGAFLTAPTALGPEPVVASTTLASAGGQASAQSLSAVIHLADPEHPGRTRTWLRSPKTQGQWLAVRDVSKYVGDKPDLLAVLKADGWHLWTREKTGQYRQQRLPARAGLSAIPGPIPAAVTNIVVSELRQYDYDPNGNLETRQTPDRLDTYGYDALDRLESDTLNGQTLAHDYDANGNRRDTTTITYHPNTNRIDTVNGVSVSYDAAGNLTADHRGRTYSYNQAGRLASITQDGHTLASYTYNARGLRTTKVTPQGTTVYHYDPAGNLLFETSDTGAPQKSYVWLENQPIAQVDTTQTGDTLTYLHTDHLATPRVGTDETGNVTWRWEGEAFGATLPQEDPDNDGTTTTVNLRFPGQYYDKESGLHYNWNRYYDTEVGRYNRVDPIGLAGGLNTYSYVTNNPLRWVDPEGLVKWEGTVSGGTLLTAGGYVFELTSECVNGQKATVKVLAAGAGLGLDLNASATSANVTFTDPFVSPNPNVFNGPELGDFFMASASISAPPTPQHKLGQLIGGAPPNPDHGVGASVISLGGGQVGAIGAGTMKGLSIGAGVLIGTSTVLESSTGLCGCEQ